MINQKEQLPLLLESDEESNFTCPRKHRSLYTTYTRNSKSKIKGAAFIIKNWPDHISSLLAYWWIGFIMIAITVFIIYNSLSIIDVATPSRLPFAAAISTNDEALQHLEDSFPVNVYMHIFVENYDEMNDEFYLKYVKRLAKKFTDYKYNIVVLLKDTLKSTDEGIQDEIKNEIAMKAVLRTDKLYRSEYWSDISIQYVILSKYLDSTPIKDSWRTLPLHTIPFLIRCISIWDKGGIAFDPVIITPISQHSKYLENLYDTLKNYKKAYDKLKMNENKYYARKLPGIPKVNNIQDIISILEDDKIKVVNIPQYNLSEAESRTEPSIVKLKVPKENDHKVFRREVIHDLSNSKDKKISRSENQTLTISNIRNNNSSIFLINGESYTKVESNSKAFDDSIMHVSNSNNWPELTLDMKGNIIATSVSCHAFIGTVFGNIIHYTVNDTVDHIITNELSIFCKGNISSCKYIDVIT